MSYKTSNDDVDSDKYVKKLLKDLKSPNLQVRIKAAKSFWDESYSIGYMDGKLLFMDKVKKFRVSSRKLAYNKIIKIISSDENDLIKAPLINCLGYQNEPKAVKTLIKCLESQNLEIRSASYMSLDRLNKYTLEYLLKTIKSNNKQVKISSIRLLGNIKKKESLSSLIEQLNDENWDIRFNSLESLGRLGYRKAIVPITVCLDDNSVNVRRKAAGVLGNFKANDLIIKSLTNSLKDDNSGVRAKSAESLGKLGDKRAVKDLEEAVKDKDLKVQTKAIKSFERMTKTRTVPECSYVTIDSLNDEQKAFYKKWLKNFNKNKFLDIEGNLGYIFAFLYLVILKFVENRDINYFLESTNKIEEGYSNYSAVKNYLNIWKTDAYCFIGDYEKALEVNNEKGWISEVKRFSVIFSKKKSNFIKGNDLIHMIGISNLTDFGKNHIDEIAEVGTLFLNDFYKENGHNVVQFFLQEFNLKNLTTKDLNKLKQFFPKQKQYDFLKNNYTHRKKTLGDHHLELIDKYSHGLFRGAPFHIDPNSIKMKSIILPNIVEEAMKNEIKRIVRECENTVREEMDLPKIGEGWISETELYYQVKKAFPSETVIHHGRPAWLGRQHLDIYFPKKNIAIEYQGDQHQNPIEYFGGEKSFKHRQILDKRKLKRCEENGCRLLYVYPDYNFKEVKEKIIK